MISVSPSRLCNRQRKARDSNPHGPCGEPHGLANRPGQPYPATFRIQWTHRESNPDLQPAELVSSRWTMSPFSSVDRRGVEPRSPGCKPGIFPLDQHAHVIRQRSVRELNPVFRPYQGRRAAETPTDQLSSSDPGWTRTIVSWMSARRLRRWTTGSVVSDRGGSRTHKITRLSTWSLCQFAYPVMLQVAGPGVAPGGRGAYEALLSTGPPASVCSDQGETRTPTPLRARRSERRVSASSTTWSCQ